MTKSKKAQQTKQNGMKLFSINDRNWEMSAAPALDYVGLGFDNHYNCHLPPINRHALAKLPYQNAQHGGILNSRSNMVSSGYLGGPTLSRMEMRAACLNLIQFGDVALLKLRNGFGQVVKLHPLSSLYMRVKKDGSYSYLMKKSLYDTASEIYEYSEKDIIFIKLYDPI